MQIIKYLKLLINFFKINLKRELEYPINLLGDSVECILRVLMMIVLFNTIFLKVNVIGDLNRNQAFLLVAYAQLCISIFFVLFMNNLANIQSLILKGNLDFILVKPVNTQFYISFRYTYFGGIGGIIGSLILLFIAFNQLNLEINWLFFIILLIMSILILYGISILLITTSLYFYKINGIYELFLSILQYSIYPSKIMPTFIRALFTYVIPIFMVTNFPIFIILNFDLLSLILMIIVTILINVLASFFFKSALKRYISATS